ISSVHAISTKPGFVCYATSKSALVGMTKAMAVDLGADLRINAICPGATATPMLLAGFEGKEEEFQQLSNMHPLERIAQPDEIASVALFLVSQEASFITGASLSVDGGIGIRLHDPV
ncbi:MAG: SDR family NAD(P)-dependent oxidoreductase, partial [Dolichospermum sp.]